MGKKINPLIFRSQFKNKRINWVAPKLDYHNLLREDKRIEDLILNFTEQKNIKINSILIFRKHTQIKSLTNALYIVILPGKNDNIEQLDIIQKLKKIIEKKIFNGVTLINLKIIKSEEKQFIFNHFIDLSKSVEFGGSIKLLLTRFLEDISMIDEVAGARIEIYGRIEGSEKSRNLKLNFGPLNLQTLKSKVQYLTKRIETKDGTLNLIFTYKLK